MVKLLASYQQNTVDAFDNEINTFYVDGVSLTHGTPRNHMWTFAAALHEFMITIAQRIHAHVLIFATLHSQQYLGLLVMTTFVTLGVKMKSITSSMETILSGMVLDVVRSTHVVPGTILHGSGK